MNRRALIAASAVLAVAVGLVIAARRGRESRGMASTSSLPRATSAPKAADPVSGGRPHFSTSDIPRVPKAPKALPDAPRAALEAAREERIARKDGAIGVNRADYGATLDRRSVEVASPFAIDGLGRPRVTWTFEEARSGDVPLARESDVEPRLHEADRRVIYERGGVEERYYLKPEGLEQVFVFPKLARPGAAISVTGRVETNLEPPRDGHSAEKLVFAYKGAEVLAISHAVAMDAAGRRLPLPLAYSAGRVSMTVPAGWVAEARLPIVIDPLIGGPTVIDSSLRDVILDVRGVAVRAADVAFGQDSYLAVWDEPFGSSNWNFDVLGQRISATGQLLGPVLSIAASSAAAYEPTVCFAPGVHRYLVAWRHDPSNNGWAGDQAIRGRVLGVDGSFVTEQFDLDDAPGQDFGPSAAFDGLRWYVCWTQHVGGSDYNARGRFVATSGTPANQAHPDLESDTAARPSAAFTGSSYVVAWEKEPRGERMSIVARTMDTAGAFTSPVTIVSQNQRAAEHADVSAGAGGKALIAWQERSPGTGWDIKGRIVTASLGFQGSAFTINARFGNQATPRGAYSGSSDQWYVAFTDPVTGRKDVYANRVTSSGAVLPAERLTTAGQADLRPELAWNPLADEVLVVFLHRSGGSYQLQGQRVGLGSVAPGTPGAPVGAPNPNASGAHVVSWAPSAGGAASYDLERSADAGASFQAVATVAAPSFTEPGISEGTYLYRVRARSGLGALSAYSDASAPVVVDKTAPAAPIALGQFRSDGATSIPVGGTTPETGVVLEGTLSDAGTTLTRVKLEVEVKPLASPFNGSGLISSAFVTSGEAVQVVVTPLTLGSYHWRARSVDEAGNTGAFVSFGANSEDAADFSVVPSDPPPPSTGLTAAAGNARVTLAWAPVAGADTYRVKRGTSTGGPYSLVSGDLSSTSYVDLGAANGTTHFYVVVAVNAAGESVPSNEASARPQAPPAAPANLEALPGNNQVTLTWSAAAEAESYAVKRSTSSGGPFEVLADGIGETSYTDRTALNGTAYHYVVSARNVGGEGPDSGSVSVTPVAPPAPPTLAAEAGNAQVSLNWTPSAGATSYSLFRAAVTGGPYAPVAQGLTTTAYVDAGLANGTPYFYVMTALNAGGESAFSNEASTTPTGPPLPPPIITTASQTTNDSTPEIAGTAEANVTVTVVFSQGGLTVETLNTTSSATGAWTVVASPKPDGTYSVVARASDGTRTSADSNGIFVAVDATPPAVELVTSSTDDSTYGVGAPIDVTVVFTEAVKLEGGELRVRLDTNAVVVIAPFGPATSAPGVYVVAAGENSPDLAALSPLELTAGATLRDLAGNNAALSIPPGRNLNDAKDIVVNTVPPPAPPQGLAAAAGDQQVTLTWNAAAGATDYVVRRSLVSGGPYSQVALVAGTLHVDVGLSNGLEYFYVVAARNASGISSNSAEASATPSGPPAPPSALTAAPGDGLLLLDWADNTEANLAGYNVYRATNAAGPFAKINALLISPSTYTNMGLENGVTVHFTVRAVNTLGMESGESNIVSATPSAPPARPTGLVATAGNGRVDLDWSDSAESNLAGYDIYRALSANGSYARINAALHGPSSYADTSVVNGTPYFYVVRAKNTLGQESADSDVATATPVAPPDVPQGLTAAGGDAQVTLAWSAAPRAATYRLFRSLQSGQGFVQIVDGLAGVTYVDTSVVNLTSYFYVVVALNAGGASASSAEAAATPSAPPAAPTALSATSVNGQISLDWADNAEPNLAGYEVYRGTDAQGPFVKLNGSPLTTSSYLDAQVTLGIPYHYFVRAKNTLGMESPDSNHVSATPSASLVPPSGLSAVPGDRAVTLSWTPVAGAIGYNVKRSGAATGPFLIVAAGVPGPSHLDQNLVNDQTYYYVVTTLDAATESGPSAVVSATPTSPPAAPAGLTGIAQTTTSVLWSWTAVAGATSYVLHDDTHAEKGNVVAPLNSFEELGLTENALVRRHVHAVRNGVFGAASAVVARYTKARDLGAADVVLTTLSPTRIRVFVAPPPNAELGQTGVLMERSKDGAVWEAVKPFTSVYLHEDFGLDPDASYFFRARLRNGDGIIAAFSPGVAAPPPPPPSAPSGFSGTGAGLSMIEWRWSDVDGEVAYELHDDLGTLFGGVDNDVTRLTELGLAENTRYTRRVRARNERGIGPSSAPATAATRVHDAEYGDFALTVLSSAQIRISVVPPSNSAVDQTGVEIERWNPLGETWEVARAFSNQYVHTDGGLSQLTLYKYRIRFRNVDGVASGHSSARSARTSVSPVQAPLFLDGISTGPDTIGWTWTANGPATSYELHDNAHALIASVTPVPGVPLGFVETALSENTPYTRHAHTILDEDPNSFTSPASPSVTRYTLVHAPTAADFTLDALSGSRVRVSVLPPPNATSGQTGVEIERSINGSTWLRAGLLVGQYVLEDAGLQGETTYHYRIKYFNGDGRAGALSPAKTVMTPASTIPTPTGLVATPGPARIELDWNDLPASGVAGFRVYRSLQSGGPYLRLTGSLVVESRYIDSAVEQGQTYYYVVRAESSGGEEGPNSNEVSGVPGAPPDPPFPPFIAQSEGVSSSSLRIYFFAIQGQYSYELHDEAHNVRAFTGVINAGPEDFIFLDDTGLQENTPYSRHLHARDGNGISDPSEPVDVWTLTRNAGLTDFQVEALSDSQIRITVTPPLNPTSATTGVLIQVSSNGTSFSNLVSLTGSYVHTHAGLAPLTTRWYRVAYMNGAGIQSSTSPSKSVTTPLGVPGGFEGTSTSLSSVLWSWSDVNGETGYQVRAPNGQVIAALGAGVLTFEETGLGENAPTSRSVRATSAGGDGASSATLTRHTWVHEPGASDFQVAAISESEIRISVAPPPNGASGQTGCEISALLDGLWTVVKPFSPDYLFVHAGLTLDLTYSYRIRFRNGDGRPTGDSPVKSAVTAPAGSVSGFTGTSQSTSSILWSWNPFEGASGYELHDDAHAVVAVLAAGLTSFEESGLGENSRHSRHVHALTGDGLTPYSAKAARYARVRDASPSDLLLTVRSAHRIDVSVAPPANPFAGSTGCEIERRNGGAWVVVKPFSASYAHADSDLLLGQSYEYRVRFRNGDGIESSFSTAVQATTFGLETPVILTLPKKTRNPQTLIRGTAPAGLIVEVYFNGIKDGEALASGGLWTYAASPKAEGSYAVSARAVSGPERSGDTGAITVVVDLTAPQPPTDLRLRPFNNTIDVEWAASPSPDVAGYLIYRRSLPSGSWDLLNPDAMVTGTKYRDSAAVNGQRYAYRVAAVDDCVSE